ncbi:Uncharacterised protein g1738 [Pycnogonum litorale]
MTSLVSPQPNLKNTISKYNKPQAIIQPQAIRCTVPNCCCDCFVPDKMKIRNCDTCKHGWVAHALEKLGLRHMYNCAPVEVVQSNTVFDIASLMLFGTTATPIRLKILLDRLFSVLQHEEVIQVLNGFGWTYEDYARGYILQDKTGNVLDRWSMPTREEEAMILQQFLRFGETKSITQQILMRDNSERPDHAVMNCPTTPKTESDIRRFIERANYAAVNALGNAKTNHHHHHHHHHHQERSLQRLPSNASSSQNLSPTNSSRSFGSPTNCTSPSLSVSPLNKLQSMHPFDYRKSRVSPPPPVVTSVSSLNHKFHVTSPTTTTTTTMTTFQSHLSSSLQLTNSKILNHHNNNNVETSAPEFWCSDDDDDEDDDDSYGANDCGALNLSTAAINQSLYASKKVRHLRKSANPMRRRWNSSSIGVLASIHTSSGKKRVQCHVCMKTFCDKGALKIHYSAVHLREMHKCTVEGCNMMFSSRRSRNRHSANPNPKLHTPNSRRKISPHDGRVANPLPILPPNLPFNPNLVSSLFPDPNLKPPKELDSMIVKSPKQPMTELAPRQQSFNNRNDEQKVLQLTNKRPRFYSESESRLSNEDDMIYDGRNKDDGDFVDNNVMNNKGVRKRKSMNPTRCAVNDDGGGVGRHRLDYSSTEGDSSSEEDGGVSFRQDELDDSSENNIITDTDSEDDDDGRNKKSERLPVVNWSFGNRDKSVADDDGERNRNDDADADKGCRKDGNDDDDDDNGSQADIQDGGIKKEDTTNERDDRRRGDDEDVVQCDETSENALRQLESLSQSTFCDFLNSATSRLMGQQHLMGGHVGFFPTTSSAALYQDKNMPTTTCNAALPTISEQGSPGSRDQQSLLQGSMSTFSDGSLIPGLDIPVDKENPRRCIACGKIFQNHFGVKTHYQNVHLKLMHKCTVDGCNAAFPSKRSRDRHSANLNLHRKLLSTSSDPASKLSANFIDKSGGLTPPSPFAPLPPSSHHQNIREELFSRLYDPHNLSAAALSFAELYKLPHNAAEALMSNGDARPAFNFFNHPLLPGFPPFFPPAAMSRDFNFVGNANHERDRETPTSLNSSASPSPAKSPPLIVHNNNNNNNNNNSKDDDIDDEDDSGPPSSRLKDEQIDRKSTIKKETLTF